MKNIFVIFALFIVTSFVSAANCLVKTGPKSVANVPCANSGQRQSSLTPSPSPLPIVSNSNVKRPVEARNYALEAEIRRRKLNK